MSDAAVHELLYGTDDEPLELSVSRVSGGVMRQPFEGIVCESGAPVQGDLERLRALSEIEECMSEIPCARRATAAACGPRCWR